MSPQGVYPAADVCAIGDEISSTYEGRHVTLYPDNISHGSQVAVVTKGYGVWFNDAVGMPFVTQTAATNLIGQGAIDTEGIWCVDVKGETDGPVNVAVAVGDRLYINTTTGLVSKVSAAATQLPFGYALGIVGSGSTERIAVKVHWDPVWAAALKARGTPGDGIIQCSVGSDTYPLLYSATGDIASEINMEFSLATAGWALGQKIIAEYAPTGDTGVASVSALEAQVACADTVTGAGWYAQQFFAVKGDLNFTGVANGAGVLLAGFVSILRAATHTTFHYLAGFVSESHLIAAPGTGDYCGFLVAFAGGYAYDFGFYAKEGCNIAYSYNPLKEDHESLAVYHVEASTCHAIQNFLYTAGSAKVGAFLYIDAAGGYYADDGAHPHATAAGEMAVNFAGAGRYIRTWKE